MTAHLCNVLLHPTPPLYLVRLYLGRYIYHGKLVPNDGSRSHIIDDRSSVMCVGMARDIISRVQVNKSPLNFEAP